MNGYHEAALYALDALLKVQYPNGAFSHNYDRFPDRPPSESDYPPLAASFPDYWPAQWPNSWEGCYSLNDRISLRAIETLIEAAEVYGDDRYLQAASKGGGFLLLAQLPHPQPAWAQQYDKKMHPVWERKFEPPAITGGESQDVVETLLALYDATGDSKYLQPARCAIAYLQSCLLPDGNLARFYELKTNRPLFFTRDYQITDSRDDLPAHYRFVVPSKLDRLSREVEKRYALGPQKAATGSRPQATASLGREVQAVLDKQDDRGAWVEPGTVRDASGRKIESPGGVIFSQSFIDNMRLLGRFVQAVSDEAASDEGASDEAVEQ